MFLKKIIALNRKIINNINEILNPFGINATDWRIFVYLSEKDNSTLSEISNFYQMDKAITSRTSSKLLKLELIEFNQSNDKREKIISLSTKGKELYFDASIKISNFEKKLTKNLDIMQKSIFINILDEINKKL